MGFENFSEEKKRQFLDDCEKAKSHLEAPLAGTVYTPICASCVHVNMHYGTWEPPECTEFDPIPPDYRYARKSDCPKYELRPNCPVYHLPHTKE